MFTLTVKTHPNEPTGRHGPGYGGRNIAARIVRELIFNEHKEVSFNAQIKQKVRGINSE